MKVVGGSDDVKPPSYEQRQARKRGLRFGAWVMEQLQAGEASMPNSATAVRNDVPRTFLGTLLQTHAHKLGLRVETEDGEASGVPYVRHDVIGRRPGDEDDWFCFSVVLVPSDHSVGVWTREMIAKEQGPLVVERNYIFDPSTFDDWLKGWFEDAVLEQLTRP